MYEVELDVIPLHIYGIVLGNPYLYDKKTMFYRDHNKYNIFKDGIEFTVRAHKMKHDFSIISMGENKMLINFTHQIQHEELQHEGIVDRKSKPTKKGKLHIVYLLTHFIFSFILDYVVIHLYLNGSSNIKCIFV